MPDNSSHSNRGRTTAETAPFARTIDLLGPRGFSRLQRAFVAVFGLGGVGSHAALALARAGVGRLRLIDVDEVTPSSLNRHAVAGLADIGRSKVAVVAEAIAGIVPTANVEPVRRFFHHDTADELLGGLPSAPAIRTAQPERSPRVAHCPRRADEALPVAVVDAIDSLAPKVALLERCVKRDVFVVSCMGASARTDPYAIRSADLAETTRCPLARRVRKQLRKVSVTEGVRCVYSVEPPLPPLPAEDSDSSYRRGRPRRRLPSLSTLPGIFGYIVANEVIVRLARRTEPNTRI